LKPIKRSVSIKGHRTSLSLEPEFWAALKEIARARDLSLAALIAEIDRERGNAPSANLSSVLRVFVLEQLRLKKSHGQ
jgi:predicted DNA-binding ribbon-helix-helix protein